MSDIERVSGPRFAALANEVSDVICAAVENGIEIDEAVSVIAAVIADYGRTSYGDKYLPRLAEVITSQAGKPLPEVTP